MTDTYLKLKLRLFIYHEISIIGPKTYLDQLDPGNRFSIFYVMTNQPVLGILKPDSTITVSHVIAKTYYACIAIIYESVYKPGR